jgi:hypothetical protein
MKPATDTLGVARSKLLTGSRLRRPDKVLKAGTVMPSGYRRRVDARPAYGS